MRECVSHLISSSPHHEQLCLTELLDDPGILAAGKLGVILRLGASHNHLAAGENQGGRLGLTNTHDDSGEPLRIYYSG